MDDYKPIRQLSQVSDEELVKAIKYSYSFSEAARKLGVVRSSRQLRTRADALGISYRHFRFTRDGKRGIAPDLIVGENALPTFAAKHLLEKLIKFGLAKNECAGCGMGPKWRDRPLTMRLNFINGDNTDRRLENLQVLCPNCWSQDRITLIVGRAKHRAAYKLKNYKELAKEEGWKVE